MLVPPRLPLPVRLYNGTRRVASRLGLPLPSLDPETLMAEARRSTGLDDFGESNQGESNQGERREGEGGGFREALDRLVESLEHDAGLHALGRTVARSQIANCLESRLRIQDVTKREPAILEGRIERPVFIVGMARTGTSILHEVIGQDPSVRVPRAWEVMYPCPPPETASYDSDPRIQKTDDELAQTVRLIPGFRRMHRMGARLPQEDVGMTALEFKSMQFEASFRLDRYTAWFHGGGANIASAYATHRRFLQVLQWRHPASRWVLKTPAHLWELEALMTAYPDACLIQTHRDPLKVLSSLTSLCTTLRAMASDTVDPRAIAREWDELNALAYDVSVEARESGLVPPDQVIDIHFAEFMADPMASIQRIYEKFDIPYTPEADARMRAYLETHTTEEHGGPHRHSFADTGLDVDEARERVKRYQEYFDVPSELE